MVVALAIFTVLLAVGWASSQQQLPRFRAVQAAKELQGDLVTLRNTAISTGRETRLVLTEAGGDCGADPDAWGGSWTMEVGDRSRRSESWELMPLDADDGTDDDQSQGSADLGPDGNRQARGVCLDEWQALEGPGSGNDDAIVFSPRGWVANPGTDFDASGFIELELVNQDATRRGVDDRLIVRLSRSGVVRLISSHDPDDTSKAGTAASSSES